MNKEERASLAAELFSGDRHNCAQAVSAALADQTGADKKELYKACICFGGGMSTAEGPCGALTGAGIVAGLAVGTREAKKYMRQMTSEFEKKCGAVICRELKEIKDGKVLCPCDVCVMEAVRIYCETVGLKD